MKHLVDVYGEKILRPTSLIMSGVESDAYFDLAVGAGFDHLLMSYHYIQRKGKRWLRERIQKYPHVKLMIDSGAYTFHVKEEEYKQKPVSYFDNYVKKYVEWIRENKDYIFSCVEVDIANIVGFERVDYYRREFFEPLKDEGILVCYVWHEYDGKQHWEEMCKRYDYVGFSLEVNDYSEAEVMKMVNTARKYGAIVHGFALTRVELMSRIPFFTGDSSVSYDSSIIVKNKLNGEIERIAIGEFFSKMGKKYGHIPTSNIEKIVPLENYQTLTVDDDLNVVWGDLYSVVRHDVKKPVIRLNLEGGKHVDVTTDHSIIAMDKEGKLYEVKADELKEGDFVLAPPSYDNENEPVGYVNVWIDKPNNKGKKELQVLEVSPQVLEFLGLWMGDGHYSDEATVGLSCYQDKECREVIDYVFNLFSAKPMVRDNEVDVRVSNVRLRRVMEALGFKGTSSTKRVPSFVYSLHPDQIKHFLRGYFSADGSGHSLDFITVSKELKDDIVELLEMLGIYTTVSYRPSGEYMINSKNGVKKESWHVTIRDLESKIKFYNEIGFLQDYKNEALLETINKQLAKGKSNTPIDAKRKGLPVSLAIGEYVYYPSGSTVDRKKIKRITREVPKNFHPKVFNCGLHFLQIKSIETIHDGSKLVDVYDLSVKDTEKFFANGVLVHNTTWLVGTQYGELNWFDGRKMKRLKKDQWKTVYKQKFINLGANWDLAGKENPYELIRINLLVFKEAEKYIRKRIRGKMYWFPNGTKLNEEGGGKTLTKKLIKRKKTEEKKEEIVEAVLPKPAYEDEGRPKTKYEEFLELSQPKQKAVFNLEEQISKLPPIEWFDGDCEDYLEVAKDINMETNGLSKDDVLDILYNYCVFLRDNYMLDEEDDQQLIDSAKFLTKRDVKDREQAIEALKQFYAQNLTGERKDFVVDESLPMEAPPRPKEREQYLEDEEYELVDVSEEELNQYLPAPKQDGSMPEVDEIDKELKSAGIIPVRDEKGRFLKGQKKVRKPKQLWSKYFPKLSCDTCYKAGECPEFKPGHVCAYEKIFKKFKTRDLQDVIDAMTSMADLNLERMQRLMLFETLDGGMPDPSLTAMIDQNMKLLMTIKQLHENRNMIVASQKRVIREDGSEETTMTITNPSGGILERLFMSSSNSEEKEERKDVTPKDNVIDAEG